ncbi:hypothetical protein FOL47_003102, partial [Perkinsus chesapeaki]
DKEEEESSVEDKEEEESSVEDKEEEESSVEDEEVPEDEKSITLGEGEGKRDQSVVEEVKETNKDKHEGTASGSGEVPLGDPLHATEAPEENKTSEEADEVEGESSSSEEEAVKLPSPFKSSLQRKISDISKDGLSPKKKGGSSPSRRLLESVKSKSEAKKDTIIEEEKATEEKPAFSGTFGSSSSTCFGAFGSTAQSSSTGFGAFGSTAQSSSTGFGAFGSTAQSSSTGFGAFGSTAQSSSTGFGAFGSTAQSSSTGFGAFGGSSASSAGPFGGSSSSSGLFGIASSSSASGGGLGAFSAASQPGTLPASKKTSSLFTPTASDKLSGAESTLEMPPSSSSVGFGIFSTSPSSAPKDGQSAATHSATKLESKPLTIGLASPETTEDKSPTKRGGGRSSPKEQHLSEASIRKVSDVARDGLSPKRKGSLSPSKRLIQGTKLKAEAAKEAVVDDEKVTSGGIFGSTTTSTAAGKPTSSGISHGLRRIRRSSVTEPTGSDWASVEKSQNKTKALLDEIAKETDDADDSREARALFSEVEKDLEQLEGFMKEANQPCRTAPEVDTNNEVWQQLIRSIDGLTDIANDDTLKQLDEVGVPTLRKATLRQIQQKNHTLNAQLDKEMLLEDEEPSETVVELKRRCEDISERIDEAYGECKKALIARRSRRQSNGNREQPKSPSCPEPSRPPIRHRPAVIVDGPTMPAPLLAPPARRRQAGAGSAIGRLANGAPQTPVRSKPSPPPTLRIQPEETVDSLRASVRRLRNPLRNRSTATAKTTSKSTTTVGALLASKPTEGKMAIATPVLALGDGKENWTENASAAGPSMWNVMRTKANVSAEIQGLWEKVSEMERRLRTLKQQQQQQQQTRHPRQALPPSVQAPMAALVDEQSPSSEETKVANLRSELRQQLNSSRAGSVGGAPSSGWSEASDYAPGSTTGAYSTPSVTNVPAARGLMFLNPLGGSGTPTFGGGRASPASSRHGSRDRQTSESPSGVSKESVKSKAAIREAVIPKTVVPPAPKLEAIPSVPPPPKLDASPIPKSVKHRTLTTSMSFGPEKAESSHPTTPDKPAFSFTSGAAAPSKPAKGDAPKKEAASIPAAAKPAGDDASAKSSAAPDGKSSEAPKPSGGLFGTPSSSSGNAFGGFGSSAQSSSSGGLFGSTSSKPATGGECGGLSSSSSSGGAFGSGSGTQSSSSTTSPFGSASSSTSSSSSSGTSKPGGLFGAPPASSPSSGGFGAPPGQSSSSGGFGAFGGTAFGQAASSSVFGQSSSSSSSTSPAFGGSAAPATSTFGSKPATASPFGAPSTSGGFGAFGAPQSSSSSASPFGAAPTSSSSGGFGAFGAKTSASPSPFGSAPSSGSGFGAFGGGGATSSSGFGAFGAASPAPQSGSGFGAFGGGGAQQPSPFGATPSGGGGGGFGSAFGSTGQSSSSGFGAFGGGNKPSTSGFGAFGGGTPAGGTGGFGAFGGSSNTQTSSGFGAFGGGGGAQSASSGFGAFGGEASSSCSSGNLDGGVSSSPSALLEINVVVINLLHRVQRRRKMLHTLGLLQDAGLKAGFRVHSHIVEAVDGVTQSLMELNNRYGVRPYPDWKIPSSSPQYIKVPPSWKESLTSGGIASTLSHLDIAVLIRARGWVTPTIVAEDDFELVCSPAEFWSHLSQLLQDADTESNRSGVPWDMIMLGSGPHREDVCPPRPVDCSDGRLEVAGFSYLTTMYLLSPCGASKLAEARPRILHNCVVFDDLHNVLAGLCAATRPHLHELYEDVQLVLLDSVRKLVCQDRGDCGHDTEVNAGPRIRRSNSLCYTVPPKDPELLRHFRIILKSTGQCVRWRRRTAVEGAIEEELWGTTVEFAGTGMAPTRRISVLSFDAYFIRLHLERYRKSRTSM